MLLQRYFLLPGRLSNGISNVNDNRNANEQPPHKRRPSPGWRIVRFGDVVRNVNVTVDPEESGLDRYVGLDHLDPESLHIKRWGPVADGTTFTRKFVPGQVLFGKRRAYQRTAAVAEFEGICSGDILVFEPANGELIPELLPFIVQSDGFFNHAFDTSTGSRSPRTRWQDLANYEFPLPPRDEQRRIAEILWSADDVVERYKLALQECEVFRMLLLEQVCSKIDETIRLKKTLLAVMPGY